MEPSPKKKTFYKQKPHVVVPGLKGFLSFCNFREKECTRESYILLNEYTDKLKASKPAQQQTDEPQEGTSKSVDEPIKAKDEEHSDDEDIAVALSKEIATVKNTVQKRFHALDSGAKNIIFIKTSEEDPVGIATAIIEDLLVTKQSKSRFLIRLVPIEITCKAYMDDIKTAATRLIDKWFSAEPKKFSVVYNHRHNNKLNRDDVIKMLATMVAAKNGKHSVSLKEPEYSIIVEIIKGICMMAVVPFYVKYKKYNLMSICAKDDKEEDQ